MFVLVLFVLISIFLFLFFLFEFCCWKAHSFCALFFNPCPIIEWKKKLKKVHTGWKSMSVLFLFLFFFLTEGEKNINYWTWIRSLAWPTPQLDLMVWRFKSLSTVHTILMAFFLFLFLFFFLLSIPSRSIMEISTKVSLN
jgi:hypothetical protein